MVNKKRSFRASANIFLLIALAIALPLTIFVAQQQQITQQEAAISSSKLGIFVLGPCNEFSTINEGGPKIMKIAVGAPVAQGFKDLMHQYKNQNPEGILILRVYDNNPNNLQSTDDPAQSARNYYATYIAPAWNSLSGSDKAIIDYVSGDNELSAFDAGSSLYFDRNASWSWYGKFWNQLAQEIKNNTGKRPLMGEWGVGHPVKTEYINADVLNAIKTTRDLGGAWSYHTYTRDYTTDVAHEEDRDSLRYRQYITILNNNGISNVPWIMGEAGVDKDGQPNDGWRDRGDANKYQDWLQWFDGQLKNDSTVKGATLFQLCDDGYTWRSFNIAPIANWLKTYLGGTPVATTVPTQVQPTQPGSTPVPQATNIPIVTSNPSQPMNPPENLGFRCPNPSQVLLTWSGGENATEFDIHFKEPKPDAELTSLVSHSYSAVINIKPNTTYSWWMEAARYINGSTETKPSDGNHSFYCDGASDTNPPPESSDPLGEPSDPQSNCDDSTLSGVISWIPATNATLHVLSVNGTDITGKRVYSDKSPIVYYLPNINSRQNYGWWVYGYKLEGEKHESGTVEGTVNCNFDGDGGSDTPPGTTTAPENTPTSVPPTATPVPPTPTPIPYPNCINLQGPTTIRLGRTVTYLAQFFAHPGGVLRGGMGAFNINSATPTDPATWNWNKTSDPYSINSNESVLRFSWTPTEIGNYHVFCQSIDDARNISCRGATAATAGEIALCKGPQTSMTVQVVSDEVPSASGRDMCQFATTIGSNAITSYRTVAVSAVAKPQFNIKNYTFAFFNADNQTKPIQFESGKSFKIESPSNTVNLTYNAMHRIDMQTGTYPQNILMKAFFTDIDGNFSNEGTGCNITLLIDDKPVPTRAAPTTGPVETSAPERPGALQLAAGLIGIGTILAAFLTNRERIFEFRSRRRR